MQLLPPNFGAVWQTVDNDNNNPSNVRSSVSWYTEEHMQGVRYALLNACLELFLFTLTKYRELRLP